MHSNPYSQLVVVLLTGMACGLGAIVAHGQDVIPLVDGAVIEAVVPDQPPTILAVDELPADELPADELPADGLPADELTLRPTTLVQQSITVNADGCHPAETICILPQDEVWIVRISACDGSCNSGNTSTGIQIAGQRGCSKNTCSAKSGLPSSFSYDVRQLVDSCWQDADLQGLYDYNLADPSHVTMVLTHGNNTNESWAITRGMQFYKYILYSTAACRPPIRLILLDWPSDRILTRPLPDYKIKSRLAVELGPHVATLLEPFGDRKPLLVGYSLGAQVLFSALSNCTSNCRASTSQPIDLATNASTDACCASQGYRMEVIAPALDGKFACSCLTSLCCDPVIRRAVVFENGRDRVVRSSRFVARRACDTCFAATSFWDLRRKGLLEGSPFEFQDITREVRPRHALINYAKSPTIKSKTVELLLEVAND